MLIIDPEFQSLISPLSAEEYSGLEDNLVANGCIAPLIVWGKILLDGHNRKEICERLRLPFETHSIELADRSAAKEWIINNQFGRRNLNAYQRSVLALKLKDITAERAKENIKAPTGGKKKLTLPILAESIDTREEIAQKAKVSHGTLAKVETIEKKATPEQKKKLETGEETINRTYTEIKKAERKRNQKSGIPAQELPAGKFNIILADPPWKYDFSETTEREIENQYPTMELQDIKDLNIPCADDSALFLWATAPKLNEALEVMKAWGFQYKTHAVWDKEKIGMGYWFRGQHELLLVGTRGSFSPPAANKRVSSVIRQKREGHSQKPDAVYEIIEQMFPDARYLELFARSKRPNWNSWGNEISE